MFLRNEVKSDRNYDFVEIYKEGHKTKGPIVKSISVISSENLFEQKISNSPKNKIHINHIRKQSNPKLIKIDSKPAI